MRILVLTIIKIIKNNFSHIINDKTIRNGITNPGS